MDINIQFKVLIYFIQCTTILPKTSRSYFWQFRFSFFMMYSLQKFWCLQNLKKLLLYSYITGIGNIIILMVRKNLCWFSLAMEKFSHLMIGWYSNTTNSLCCCLCVLTVEYKPLGAQIMIPEALGTKSLLALTPSFMSYLLRTRCQYWMSRRFLRSERQRLVGGRLIWKHEWLKCN